jgi:hypothetical protein
LALNAELSNNITANSPVRIGGNPFHESKVGKLIGQRVVSSSSNAVRIEQSIIENGIIKEVGKVANLQTWTGIFRSPQIVYGTG